VAGFNPVILLFETRRFSMSSPKLVLRLLAAITLVAILAGCSNAPTATTAAPTTAPTNNQQNLQPTFNAIATQAAQTVIANLTQNAPTATPVTPTNTALPSATPAPSNTPLPPATQTATFVPWTLTPTPAAYACSITSVSPSANSQYTSGANFDGIWVVKNTGTQKWLSAETDARWSSGEKLQKSGDIQDLKNDVAPNESYTVSMDMVAKPTSVGTYTTTWVLITGKITICTLNITIVVK
jgi:hypothetical protein